MNLQEIIDLEINNILNEIRTQFNLEKFKSIKDIWKKIDYAEENLKFTDEGTSRIVFILSNRFVLKIADPTVGPRKKGLKVGIEQNKSEVEIYQTIKDKSLITKIYKWADDYLWIISELVRPLKNYEEFEKLTGIKYEQYYDLINYIEDNKIRSNIKKTLLNAFKKKNNNQNLLGLLNKDFIIKLFNLIEFANLDPIDVMRYGQWGKTVDNNIVLLDYGLTQTVRKKFYEN